jgi:hypothetical protein
VQIQWSASMPSRHWFYELLSLCCYKLWCSHIAKAIVHSCCINPRAQTSAAFVIPALDSDVPLILVASLLQVDLPEIQINQQVIDNHRLAPRDLSNHKRGGGLPLKHSQLGHQTFSTRRNILGLVACASHHSHSQYKATCHSTYALMDGHW